MAGHGHEHGDEVREARESRNAALTGLAVAIVWIGVVSVISYMLVG